MSISGGDRNKRKKKDSGRPNHLRAGFKKALQRKYYRSARVVLLSQKVNFGEQLKKSKEGRRRFNCFRGI